MTTQNTKFMKRRKKTKHFWKFFWMYFAIGVLTGILNIGLFYWYFGSYNLKFSLFFSGALVGLIGYGIEMFRWKYYILKDKVEDLKKYKKEFLK